MKTPLIFPTRSDIEAAAERLSGVVQATPLVPSKTFEAMANHPIWLKLENMQKTGSFKIRGAYNLVSHLDASDRSRGVIAASAGNHAQGVALAANHHGVPCVIVMPEGASLAKIAATQSYGATVVLHGESYDDAYEKAKELQYEAGYTYVHAFDHPDIVAGQGTVGLEILAQHPAVNTIVVPMGGGGLATGIAVAVKETNPNIRIIGVEAETSACFYESRRLGQATTIPSASTVADGIAVKRPGTLTFALSQLYVDDVLTVTEEEIVRSMLLLMERSKLVTEGAGAAALAAAIHHKLGVDAGDVVVVLSGGNVDTHLLSRLIEHGLVQAGRYVRVALTLADRPGSLRNLLQVVADTRANVLTIRHQRLGHRLSIGETEVELHMETRDEVHIQSLLLGLERHGYRPIRLD